MLKPKSENITRHHSIISRQEREGLNNHKSCILWFTGLSGSGKSTVACAIERALHAKGCHAFVLDGDNIRHDLNKDLGFSKSDRQENIRRIGEVSKLFMNAGLIVLTAFISPFRDDRDVARSLVDENDFIEIYCNSSLEKCKERDVKGLYKKAMSGEIKEFTGISSLYEIPEKPELVLDTGNNTLEKCVEDMIKYLIRQGYIWDRLNKGWE